MVAATPPVIETKVVAVSAAHRPFTDGRFRRGDTIEVSIRDTALEPGDPAAYRVCLSFPHLHDVRCERAVMRRSWPREPVRFRGAAPAAAIVQWFDRIHLLAQRRLRLVR